jgi:hypothetical protein
VGIGGRTVPGCSIKVAISLAAVRVSVLEWNQKKVLQLRRWIRTRGFYQAAKTFARTILIKILSQSRYSVSLVAAAPILS